MTHKNGDRVLVWNNFGDVFRKEGRCEMDPDGCVGVLAVRKELSTC